MAGSGCSENQRRDPKRKQNVGGVPAPAGATRRDRCQQGRRHKGAHRPCPPPLLPHVQSRQRRERYQSQQDKRRREAHGWIVGRSVIGIDPACTSTESRSTCIETSFPSASAAVASRIWSMSPTRSH